MDGQSNPSAVRARSAASRRSRPCRTAAASSSSTPPCSAAWAAAWTAPCRSRSSARRSARSPREDHGSSSASAAVSGRVELQGGLAAAPGVDVLARAQRELLAGQHGVAAAEQRAEALLRAQRRVAPRARRATRGKLERLHPAPVGHLIALAVADAHDDRLLAAHLAHVRIGGRGALHVQHAVERGHRRLRLGLARGAQPALGGGLVGEGLRGDERHAPGGDRRRGGGGRARARRPRSHRRSGAPSVETTSTCSISPACPRTHVAAVGRARGPRGTRAGRSRTGYSPTWALLARFGHLDRVLRRLDRHRRVVDLAQPVDELDPLARA